MQLGSFVLGFRAAILFSVLLFITIVPIQAFGQSSVGSPISSDIVTGFQRSAEDGPRALLDTLDQVLAANPQLVADVPSASALARAVSAPVGQFRGSNVPVYRDIVAKIIAAAPENLRIEISKAVADVVRDMAMTDPMVTEPLVRDIAELSKKARAQAEKTASKRGIPVGSFLFYPEAQVSEFYDDNIFATKTDNVDDFVTVVSPHVFVVSNWKKHRVNLEAHTDVTRYGTNDKENSTDYWFSGEGRYDISTATNAFGGLLYGKFHEERSSPDDVNGTEPTDYTERRAFAGISHKVEKMTLNVGGTWESTRYDDSPTSTTTINNSDRDWSHATVGARVGYKATSRFEPFVDANFDQRSYKESVDDNGFDRDSSGYKVTAGTRFRVAGTATGQVFAGFHRQNYDDAALEDVSAPIFGGNVRWRFLPSTLFTGWMDRSIEETTLFASPSYVYTGGGAAIEHKFLRQLLLNIGGSYAVSDFQGVARSDDDYNASATLRYLVTDNLFVASDYRFQRRVSNISTADYKRHQVFLRVGVQY